MAKKAVEQQARLPNLPKCRAMFDYDARDADELSFRENDVIEIEQEGKNCFTRATLF